MVFFLFYSVVDKVMIKGIINYIFGIFMYFFFWYWLLSEEEDGIGSMYIVIDL